MMDYTLPVAKRTRSRVALMYKDYHQKIKKQRREKSGTMSASQSDSSFKLDVEAEEKANGSKKLGSFCRADSESIASKELHVNVSEEEADEDVSKEEFHVDALGGDGGDNASFVGLENLGKEANESSQKGIEGTDDSDDSEDDVVCLDEGSDLGAKLCDKDLTYIHDDDEDNNDLFSSKVLGQISETSSLDVDDGETKRVGVSLDKPVNEISGLYCDGKGSGVTSRDSSGLKSMETSEDYCDNDNDNDGDVSKKDSDESEMSTSEEDSDHSSDEDYEVEKSASDDDMGSSSSEEEVFYIGKSVAKKKASDKENSGSKPIDSDNNKINGVHEEDFVFNNVERVVNSVAKRTRSHVSFGCSKNAIRNVSRPLNVDEEKLDVPRVQDDDNESDDDDDEEDDEKNQRVQKSVAKRSTSTGRKQVLKYHDAQNILVNSILGMEELSLEDSLSSGSELDYSSGIEDSTPPKKSECEEEIDKLWAEMNFALASCEINSTNSVLLENEDTDHQKLENQAARCQRGKHELILNEEIGTMCMFCPFVELEIRHIAPSFYKRASERSSRDPTTLESSIFDELNNLNLGSDSQTASDSYSPEGTVWDLMPSAKNGMYPHQREGFEFIWNKLAGGIKLDELKKQTSADALGGCIISHAPGTGKSRLTIVFLQSYMKLYPDCRPVIVAPSSMLLPWEEELGKWKIDIPFHNLNNPELSGKEDCFAVSFMNKVMERGERRRAKLIRLVKMYSWRNAKDRSILGISYRLFARLVGKDKKPEKLRKEADEKVRKIFLDCPGLFVFDEGHTPRNHKSDIFKALSNIKTDRRIILSGTPFQNNFEELFNILCLVAPKFAETIPSGNQRYVKKRGRKINEAKEIWASLTNSIGKVPDEGYEVKDENLRKVRNMISSIAHIHRGEVLKERLPGLTHYTVVLQPDEFQKSLLEGVQRSFLREGGGSIASRGLLKLDHLVSVISVHPFLLPRQFDDNEEFVVDRVRLEQLEKNPEAGIKTKFLMMLLKLSVVMGEKVLVFSQYIEPLTLIMDQLKTCLYWMERKEVMYMDGKRDLKERQSSINVFNDPKSEAKVLLASIRACGEGINLVGASRVVLLDVAWNPSVERQAISRAYRLGQQRRVYVYHLITSGTMEQKKCSRQALKDRCSKLVFSSSDRGNQQQRVAAGEVEDKILEEIMGHDRLIEEIMTEPEESKLIDTFVEPKTEEVPFVYPL